MLKNLLYLMLIVSINSNKITIYFIKEHFSKEICQFHLATHYDNRIISC